MKNLDDILYDIKDFLGSDYGAVTNNYTTQEFSMEEMLKVARELQEKHKGKPICEFVPDPQEWPEVKAIMETAKSFGGVPVLYREFLEKPILMGGVVFVKDQAMAEKLIEEINSSPELKDKFEEVKEQQLDEGRVQGGQWGIR